MSVRGTELSQSGPPGPGPMQSPACRVCPLTLAMLSHPSFTAAAKRPAQGRRVRLPPSGPWGCAERSRMQQRGAERPHLPATIPGLPERSRMQQWWPAWAAGFGHPLGSRATGTPGLSLCPACQDATLIIFVVTLRLYHRKKKKTFLISKSSGKKKVGGWGTKPTPKPKSRFYRKATCQAKR